MLFGGLRTFSKGIDAGQKPMTEAPPGVACQANVGGDDDGRRQQDQPSLAKGPMAIAGSHGRERTGVVD